MLKKIMFALFLFLGASLQSQSLNFLTPVDISATSTGATNPQIDFNSSGNGICVWSQTVGANTLILAARTANFGAAWDTPKTISTLGANAVAPQIAFGTDGNAICVWSEGAFPYEVKASKTNDGGITWSTPVALSANNAIVANLAFDSFHNMFCAIWQTQTSTFTSSTPDNGANWETPVLIDSSGTSNFPAVSLSFDSSGNGIAGFMRYGGNPASIIYASRTTNGGASWTTPIIFYTSTGGLGSNTVSVAMGENNHAIYAFGGEVSPYHNRVTSSTDAGLTWSTQIDLSAAIAPPGSVSASPKVVLGSNGNAICIWGAPLTHATVITRTSDSGQSWVTPITFPGVDYLSRQISMSGNNAIAVWLNTDGANNLVQAIESADSGATWSTPVFISLSGQTALTPQIKVFSNIASNSGPVAVSVWVSNNGGSFTVQSATTFAESPISGFSAFGEQSTINSLFQKDIVNKISWTSIASAVTYRVYSGNTLLFQGMSPYYQHGLKSGIEYTYSVRWVDALGAENDPLTITLP